MEAGANKSKAVFHAVAEHNSAGTLGNRNSAYYPAKEETKYENRKSIWGKEQRPASPRNLKEAGQSGPYTREAPVCVPRRTQIQFTNAATMVAKRMNDPVRFTCCPDCRQYPTINNRQNPAPATENKVPKRRRNPAVPGCFLRRTGSAAQTRP